ncbi:MAG TPA: hypothetical protein PLM22_00800 [Candidatus Sabulitectum sp.]|nr:hypothetical protein [Candidatus Sabulitectum sp.]HPF31388.1 hypothetical protein [Candidatus Sabulitectum sp.]HPJ27438.1 hypothetical protein [Candidatus Sabulitectum sp.]HPR21337.1 hypothetical protein [Candidatus Sabulitectum sp.]HRW78925.1 hypothetical protein [Candidatus Sabulitectum sp.]
MTTILTAAAIATLTVSPEGFQGITPETTMEYLVETFGAENVEEVREHLGEGYYSEGALVYGGTEQEFSVVWEEGMVTQIRFTGPAITTGEGIGIGSTLEDLEAVIGEFPMAGFAWDAEGWADLEGTLYEGLYIRLTPEAPVSEEYLGDAMFSSADFHGCQCRIADMRLFL